MIDLKTLLKMNESLDDYDNPDIDPDLVIGKRAAIMQNFKRTLREQLENNFYQALEKHKK